MEKCYICGKTIEDEMCNIDLVYDEEKNILELVDSDNTEYNVVICSPECLIKYIRNLVDVEVK